MGYLKTNNMYEGINATKTYLDETDSFHRVFDLSIENIEERKQKAKDFDSANQVAAYLGVRVETVFRNRSVGKTVVGINKKTYSIRKISK